MLKKMMFLVVILLVVLLFSGIIFADPIDYDISQESSEDFSLVDITISPDNETEAVNDYDIVGYAKAENIRVELFILEDEEYVRLEDIDGESGWDIDLEEVFSKKVILPYIGADNSNDIKVAAFNKLDEEKILDVNLQVTDFSKIVYEEEVKENLNKPLDIKDTLLNIFNKKSEETGFGNEEVK